jgi:peptide/nickel transport system ATP-binding protein
VIHLTETLLSVRDLRVSVDTARGQIFPVDGISFEIRTGETLGLVGESGSGKTLTALSIMRLLRPPARIARGSILLKGEDIASEPESKVRGIRGKVIAMSFQDPLTYLNPVMRVGDQIAESIMLHQGVAKRDAKEGAVKAMETVGIRNAPTRSQDYPHQLSGGMRQRILLAIAISCKPELLIADEITTALDVRTQRGILNLLANLKESLSLSILMISHDMGVVAGLCDSVAVMYAGKIVEVARTDDIFASPLHPYTEGLLTAVPRIDMAATEELKGIEGSPPSPAEFPKACRFNPRCPFAFDRCVSEEPPLATLADSRQVACWLRIPQGQAKAQ